MCGKRECFYTDIWRDITVQIYDKFTLFPFWLFVDPQLFNKSVFTYNKQCIDLEEQSQIHDCSIFRLNKMSNEGDIQVRNIPKLQIRSKWLLPSLIITQGFAHIP